MFEIGNNYILAYYMLIVICLVLYSLAWDNVSALKLIIMFKKFFIVLTIVLMTATLGLANFYKNQAQGNVEENITDELNNQTPETNLIEDETEPTKEIDELLQVVYFYQPTCGVCTKVKPVIDDLDEKYEIDLLRYDVSENNDNRSRFAAFGEAYGIKQIDNHVPAVYVGEKYFMGEKPISDELEPFILSCLDNPSEDRCQLKLDPDSEEALNYSFTGDITCSDGTMCVVGNSLSIWVIITAALADSINPCAIAVLILLLTYLLNVKVSKRRMVLLGMIYIATVYIVYLLAGLGLLKFLNVVELSTTLEYIIAGIIILLALLNLKDVFLKSEKSTLAIPESAKPYIKKYISKATVLSLIIAGFIVAAVELPCTGAVYLGILSLLSGTDNVTGFAYLVLYNLIFVMPLIIIVILAALGKDLTKIDELRKSNKNLVKIIMSVVMIGLALLLILV